MFQIVQQGGIRDAFRLASTSRLANPACLHFRLPLDFFHATSNLATTHAALVGANDLPATFVLCLWR